MIGQHRETYVDKVLDKFMKQDSKRGCLPMFHGITLSKTQCLQKLIELSCMDSVPYAFAKGSIICAMICTKQDVTYDLCMCSKFQVNSE